MSLPSILSCAAKRRLAPSLKLFKDHKAIYGPSNQNSNFCQHNRETIFKIVPSSCFSLKFHTSSGLKSNQSDKPPKDTDKATSIVQKEAEPKKIDVKDKSLAKLPPSGERKVSTLTGKTRDKITADYNNKQFLIKIPKVKPYESTYVTNRPLEPIERSIDALRPKKKRKTTFIKEGFNYHYDVCIIGGGIIGSSIAYWLAQRVHNGLKVCVVERDPSYRTCSTTLSVGGLRQQFSLPENVQMSLFGADFLRSANRLLYVHGKSNPDVQFQPHGYLFLATEEGTDVMQENHRVQMECGAKVELLSAKRLKYKFPWLNTDGIAMGSYGYENEGWFDPWSLLSALKIKAMDLGVDYIHGEVYNMAHVLSEDKIYQDDEEAIDEAQRIFNRPYEAHIHLPDGDVFPICASIFVIAAGPESGHVAHLCGFGAGEGLFSVPLPVEPRKRFVYNVHCPTGPGLDCPLVVDPTGAYFRREGLNNHYLCGMSPTEEEEPSIENDDIDFDFYDNKIWPIIANRVPSFENSKVKNAWCGFYDYNTWDQNAIVGNHPYHGNIIFATGFSGHGLQQAPAIGRAVMEYILDNGYQTIDLTRFGYDRILNDVEIKERNIV